MTRSKKPSHKDMANEVAYVHFQCIKCDRRAVLPEKIWLKRGPICNRCHHRVNEEG